MNSRRLPDDSELLLALTRMGAASSEIDAAALARQIDTRWRGQRRNSLLQMAAAVVIFAIAGAGFVTRSVETPHAVAGVKVNPAIAFPNVRQVEPAPGQTNVPGWYSGQVDLTFDLRGTRLNLGLPPLANCAWRVAILRQTKDKTSVIAKRALPVETPVAFINYKVPADVSSDQGRLFVGCAKGDTLTSTYVQKVGLMKATLPSVIAGNVKVNVGKKNVFFASAQAKDSRRIGSVSRTVYRANVEIDHVISQRSYFYSYAIFSVFDRPNENEVSLHCSQNRCLSQNDHRFELWSKNLEERLIVFSDNPITSEQQDQIQTAWKQIP